MKKYWTSCLAVMLIFACKPKEKEDKSTVEEKDSTTVESAATEVATTEVSPTEVYYKGVGTEPFWWLKISDGAIEFTSLVEGYESFITPHTEPILAADANVKMYSIQTESVSLRIEIVQGDCSDGMSDRKFNYSTSVEIRRGKDTESKVFEGCGEYVADYRLNDIWVLEEMEGQQITPSDFENELPRVEINTSANRFVGFAGCNEMKGTLFSEKSRLRFTRVATTKMMCPDSTNEAAFLQDLQSVTQFDIKDNRLYLFNPSGLLLVFKKVD